MRLRTLKRLRRLQHDPLGPVVYVALFGICAYILFIINWLRHNW
jgi:hypothetical protein